MPIILDGTAGLTNNATDLNYTGTLTGGTGVVNLGSGQVVKDASGNVGIGTSSPGNRLMVSSPLTGTTPRSNTVLRVQSEATGRDVNIQFSDTVTNAAEVGMVSGNMYFATSGLERARIDSSGNLLVGTTSFNTGNASISFSFADGYQTIRRASGASQSMMIFYNGGNFVGEVRTSTTTTSYITSSDYRLKEDVQPMTGALARVAALKPVTYKWKVNGSDGEGFIAHELQAVVPDCVTGEKDAVDKDGKPQYQGIDTSFLVATLTAAIQELKAIVDTQAARITALEAK